MMIRKTMSRLAAVAVLALAAGSVDAQVSGTIKFEGTPPEAKPIDMSGVAQCAAQHPDPVMDDTILVGEGGALANVLVSIKPDEGMDLGGNVPTEPAVLDQEGCQYFPRVVAMMAGQTLKVKNSDPFMHNVNLQAKKNPPFNLGQPNKDPGQDVKNLKTAEVIPVKCEVHPWMRSYVVVLEHPYFATSNEEGKFSFDAAELPDGEYTLTAWHETLGTQEKKVTIEGGKASVDFSFAAKSADASGSQSATVVAAGSVESAACPMAMACCETTDKPTTRPADGTTAAAD